MKNNSGIKSLNQNQKINLKKIIIDIIFLNILPLLILFILNIFHNFFSKIILSENISKVLIITIIILIIFVYLLFSIIYLLKKYNFKIAMLLFLQVFFIFMLYVGFTVSNLILKINNYNLFFENLKTIQKFDKTLKQNKNTIIQLKKELNNCKKK